MIIIRVVFVDIDGVLNSRKYFKSRKSKISEIDINKIVLLKKIIDATDAKIVISSSWRIPIGNKEYRKLLVLLNKYGMDVIGYTPALGGWRCDEIQQYLDDNKDKNIESFVILDDDSYDMGKFIGNELIQTSFENGLIEDHVKIAISKLNN